MLNPPTLAAPTAEDDPTLESGAASAEVVIQARDLGKSYTIWASPVARIKGPILWRLGKLPFLPRRLRDFFQRIAHRSYREFRALRDVSFELCQGESMGIIGRNGSGKSTLLQLIVGTLRPTAGEVRVRGKVAALLELGSGFNPEFTGRENVSMTATIYGLSQQEIDARFDSILAFADIGDFIEQPVKTYSSGMVLRLAFAVIAHVDADVLIIDEALAVGDVFFVQKCIRFIRRFQETGVLLFVTHDPGTVAALCQKAIWLDQGQMRLIGTPKLVAEAYMEANIQAAQPDAGELAASSVKAAAPKPAKPAPPRAEPTVDQRTKFLNNTCHRNDIQLFEFDESAASFGTDVGEITEVYLADAAGAKLAWVVGGETVVLTLIAEAHRRIDDPILGFFIKDRLGQHLFGNNTYIYTGNQRLGAEPGERIVARFAFQMPVLPAGDYSVLAALAEGSQEGHIVHHWVHDAMAFKSVSSSVSAGMIGLPMLEVTMTKRSTFDETPRSI